MLKDLMNKVTQQSQQPKTTTYYTVYHSAKVLGVSTHTILQYMAENRIKYVKHGNILLCLKSEIENLKHSLSQAKFDK